MKASASTMGSKQIAAEIEGSERLLLPATSSSNLKTSFTARALSGAFQKRTSQQT
jgi:hypothetical protein